MLMLLPLGYKKEEKEDFKDGGSSPRCNSPIGAASPNPEKTKIEYFFQVV